IRRHGSVYESASGQGAERQACKDLLRQQDLVHAGREVRYPHEIAEQRPVDDDTVGPASGRDHVGSGLAVGPVISTAALADVIAGAADQNVVAIAAAEAVIGVLARNGVVAGEPGKYVVAGIAEDVVVLGVAGAVDCGDAGEPEILEMFPARQAE